jgi:ribosomal protein S21
MCWIQGTQASQLTKPADVPVRLKLGKHLQVFVRENNVEQALRLFKNKMQREGAFREMKRRKVYEKPPKRKTRQKSGNHPPCARGSAQTGSSRGTHFNSPTPG